ncbi:hypothetical protein DUI87_16241 [Hirundo rustica rustica]|uniref:Core shell protein Gag P30 domain-containing protein n=1 Tax=Hirundo rustica rustica TaxID=333673 RepID=A0A3M0K0S9_HIRRU|nr:hypothetical protein DUI87_16241 [Hirundo rustica rustica]
MAVAAPPCSRQHSCRQEKPQLASPRRVAFSHDACATFGRLLAEDGPNHGVQCGQLDYSALRRSWEDKAPVCLPWLCAEEAAWQPPTHRQHWIQTMLWGQKWQGPVAQGPQATRKRRNACAEDANSVSVPNILVPYAYWNTSAEFLWEDMLPKACVLDDDTDIKDEVDLTELCIISGRERGTKTNSICTLSVGQLLPYDEHCSACCASCALEATGVDCLISPSCWETLPLPDKGESDGAAAEPTDVTTVQVPAEPQGQPQPAAVAPVETKKYKVKSEHPGNKDKKGGPSQPGEESEVEIITESLTYESLRNLQKDLARRGREAYTAWLLRVWDLIGTGVQLDSSEARNLGPLTQDSGVNQVFVREPGPLSLWERLLMSVRERFVHRDRMQEHHHRMRWKTLEEGIQQLREVAVLEVLFGRGGQHDNDPDKVKCTGQMLWNLATLGPSQYATYIATIHPDTNRETVGSVANKLRNYESIICSPMQAQVSAVAKELREEMREKMEEVTGKMEIKFL